MSDYANLTFGSTDSGSPNIGDRTTASISPTNRSLVLVFVGEIIPTSNPAIPTLSGLSITWNQIQTVLFTGSGHLRGTLFYGIANGNSGVLTIGVNGTNVQNIYWNVDQINIADVSINPIVQSNTNGGQTSSPAVSLSSFATLVNLAYGVIYQDTSGGITQGGGFTQINQYNPGIHGIESEYKASSATNVNWSLSGTPDYVAIAIEIKKLILGGAFAFLTI